MFGSGDREDDLERTIQSLREQIKSERSRSAKLIEVINWMRQNRAATIFIEEAEHVTDFFRRADQVIAEYEASRD